MSMKRRELLAAGLGLNIASTAMALAQQGGAAPDRAGGARGASGGTGRDTTTPTRVAKTARLFKSPGLYPNALRRQDRSASDDGRLSTWIV